MTNGRHRVPDKDGQSEVSEKDAPYALPGDGQLLAYWHYKKSTRQPLDLGTVPHKNVESKDVKAEIVTGGQATDTNAELIRELRGRKARGRSFSKSRYVRDVRQLCRWRLILGQKRDACIQLERQLDIENKKFLRIKQEYRQCAAWLERFLAEDDAASTAMLEAAEAEQRRTEALSLRRDALSRSYGQSRLELYHWEETWRTLRACHRFLLQVAPLANDAPDEQDLDDGNEEVREFELLCEPSHFNDHGVIDESLCLLIQTFEREANTLPRRPGRLPGELGLTEPADLLRIFRAIELQNLNALVHLETLAGPMADMLARIDVAETHVRQEIDDVLQDIRRLERSIAREERRAQRLEQSCGRLVQQGFRALVCSEEALRVRVLVEDAYESCVAANEAGLEPLAMARGLERAYERLSAQLDLLPPHLVAACEREGFMRELKESRDAEDAARKFALMHRLLDALKRMMEPPEPRTRVPMRRSVPLIRGRVKRTPQKQPSTPARPKTRSDNRLNCFELCGDEDNEDDAENSLADIGAHST